MNNLYFFTGAASTGKTSVINEAKEMFNDVYIQTSITREFYKKSGITNELEIQNYSVDKKKDFQLKMLDFYVEHTLKETNNSKSHCIIDRSPIDYFAWTLYMCPQLTIDEYKQTESKINYFFKEISNSFNTRFCEFIFPTPWVSDQKSSDGFRYDPFGKNIVLSFVLDNLINNYYKNNPDSKMKYIKVPTVYNENVMSAKERLLYLLRET
jgi:hypothetical protein